MLRPLPYDSSLIKLALLLLVGFLLPCPGALAHDFWLEPSWLKGASQQKIDFQFKVGHAFEGETLAFDSKRVRQLFGRSQSTTINLLDSVQETEASKSLAASLTMPSPGTWWFAFESQPTTQFMRPKDFEAYLREEGLDAILALRQELGESDRLGFEAYARCCKALVLSESPQANHLDLTRPLGLTLEIVPQESPQQRRDWCFQVLYRGKPCPSLLVEAYSEEEPHSPQTLRTDEQGQGTLALGQSGRWMVTCVHMVPHRPDKKSVGTTKPDGKPTPEWNSYWASMFFEVAAHE